MANLAFVPEFPLGGELPKSKPITRDHRDTPSRQVSNLSSVDLNLLVALEALLEQRTVTLAAKRVGLSQPAMSRALAKLRGLFNDDLLVRTSFGLVPTPQGERIAAVLPSALNAMREIVTGRSFGLGEWRSKARVAMPDLQALVLLPYLLLRLNERAPHLQIVTDPQLPDTLRRLEQGEIDLAIGQVGNTGPGFYKRTLYSDSLVCLLRKEHPVLMEAWTVASFSALRHAIICSESEDAFSNVYDGLRDLVLPDASPVLVSSAMAAPAIIAETDLVMVVPLRAANRLAAMLPLAVVEPPVEFPSYEVAMIWHERRHRDPDYKWLRGEFAAAAIATV